MSACQLSGHNPPEQKSLPVWFPANIVLQPIFIYVFYKYPIGILDASIAKTTYELGFGVYKAQKEC